MYLKWFIFLCKTLFLVKMYWPWDLLEILIEPIFNLFSFLNETINVSVFLSLQQMIALDEKESDSNNLYGL